MNEYGKEYFQGNKNELLKEMIQGDGSIEPSLSRACLIKTGCTNCGKL